MRDDDVRHRLDDIEKRLAALETSGPQRPWPALPPEDPAAGGVVTYSGSGRHDGGPVAWSMQHEWGSVLSAPGSAVARVLDSLGNPVRIRVVAALIDGPLPTAALAARLGQPSTGQLFHHLKDLLSARVIHQPVRGTYAVRHQDVVPLLAMLAAASDIAGPDDTDEPS